MQLEQRTLGTPVHELLPVESGFGLARLTVSQNWRFKPLAPASVEMKILDTCANSWTSASRKERRLLDALRLVRERGDSGQGAGKALIFTESLTTQEYLRALLGQTTSRTHHPSREIALRVNKGAGELNWMLERVG